jgi:two-component system sensor histidine kinase AtoS
MTYGKKHGTGLGMAIVKKVIDDHKGRIEIDSELGKGTTIRILLPIA